MMRKTIIALAAAVVALGMTQMTTNASAAHGGGGRMGGGGGAMIHAGGGGMSHAGGFIGRPFGGMHMTNTAFRNHAAFGNRVAFRNHAVFRNRVVVNNRFAFRHHFRHRFFRNKFVVAPIVFASGSSCFVVRHVWTHWGWRWHRVWVCG